MLRAPARSAASWDAAFDQVVATYRSKAKKSPGENAIDAQAFTELDEATRRDPAVRQGLMERFQLAADEIERQVIKTLLSRHPGSDVLAFSRQLIDAEDSARRRDGFDLLLAAPATAESHEQLAQALAREPDTSVVIGTVATLAKRAAEPSPSTVLAARLRTLSQSADAAVRSVSLRALSRWDPSEQADSLIEQALEDPLEEIRLAAISALAANTRRTAALQSSLASIVSGAGESLALRFAALGALRGLPPQSTAPLALDRIALELEVKRRGR